MMMCAFFGLFRVAVVGVAVDGASAAWPAPRRWMYVGMELVDDAMVLNFFLLSREFLERQKNNPQYVL